jgi:hypothetical protein
MRAQPWRVNTLSVYFEKARVIAAERLWQMEAVLTAFEQESFGYF